MRHDDRQPVLARLRNLLGQPLVYSSLAGALLIFLTVLPLCVGLLLVIYLAVLIASVPATLTGPAAEGVYVIGTTLGACVLYLGFGLSVWIGQGRFVHVSIAEILVIVLFSTLELLMGCSVSAGS